MVDPAQIELDCCSNEPGERDVRYLVRTRYGDVKPVAPSDLQPIRGLKMLRREPSLDLLRLEAVLRQARKRSNERGLTEHQRRLRQNHVDAIKEDVRFLLNAEAGEKYSMYDLELRECGPIVVIGADISHRRK